MIDYEKLKLAHELILKVDEKYSMATHVSCNFDTYHRLYALNCDWFEDFDNLDILIDTLKALIKAYPRDALDELIDANLNYWTCLKNQRKSTQDVNMSMSPPFEGEIKGFASCCSVHAGGYEECSNPPRECLHEGDGKHYQFDDNYDRSKCKKCGGFYR